MDPMGGVPNLLKPSQIAEILNVSEKTIYYWVERNEIPFIKVGRHLRFVANDVIRFFSEKTVSKRPYCHADRSAVKSGSPRSLTSGASARTRDFASKQEE